MKYTLNDLEKDIEGINSTLKKMRAEKGHDYGSHDDTLNNLRFMAPLPALLRADDKLARIKTWAEKGTLKNESLKDSMLDLINYAYYLLITWQTYEEDGTVFVTDEEDRRRNIRWLAGNDYQTQHDAGLK